MLTSFRLSHPLQLLGHPGPAPSSNHLRARFLTLYMSNGRVQERRKCRRPTWPGARLRPASPPTVLPLLDWQDHDPSSPSLTGRTMIRLAPACRQNHGQPRRLHFHSPRPALTPSHLPQNRICILISNPVNRWRLKYGVAGLILLVNVSVYCLWIRRSFLCIRITVHLQSC